MQNHLWHMCGPTWCSRKKIIDALGHGFAALCREKLLLFGDKHHHLGHLVQRCLGVGQPSGQEGVPSTELHVLILQRQERHHKINEVLSEELAVGVAVLWSTTQGRAKSEASAESICEARLGSEGLMQLWGVGPTCAELLSTLSSEHLQEPRQETPQCCPVTLSCLLPTAIFRAEGARRALGFLPTCSQGQRWGSHCQHPGMGWSEGLLLQAQLCVAHSGWDGAEGQLCRLPTAPPTCP